MYQVSIYRGTTLIGLIEAEPRRAWPAAVSYVKSCAHADGVEGGAGLGETVCGRGRRATFERGIFRAVETRMRPV